MPHFTHHHLYHQPLCDHSTFFSSNYTHSQACSIALNHCHQHYQFINFFAFNYCLLNNHLVYLMPLAIIIIIFIFMFIYGLLQDYIIPSFTYISSWLNLSDSLAAFTLLAFANGAADVITSLAAIGVPEGLNYNIGCIYGSGLFVMTVIVSLTIINSHQIQLESSFILRDLGFYVLATLTIFTFGFIGELNYITAIILLLEYILLVILVIVMDKNPPKQVNYTIESKHEIILFEEAKKQKKQYQLEKYKHAVQFLIEVKKMKIKQIENFNELTLLRKIEFIINAPFSAIRWLTLPPCEPYKYTKIHASIFCPFYMMMVYLIVNWGNYNNWIFCWILVGLFIGILIYITSSDKLPRYYILLEVLGVIGGLCWNYLVSGILIDLLQFLGMVSQFPSVYLGLTVIGIGNALNDGITTVKISKQGFGIMGIRGCYGGQVFILLVGFSLSLIKLSLIKSIQKFELLSEQLNLLLIGTTLLVLILTCVYGVIKKYTFGLMLSRMLFGIYLLFIVIATYLALQKTLI